MASEIGGPAPKHEKQIPDLEKEQAVLELVEKLRTLREAIADNPSDELRSAAQVLVDKYSYEEPSTSEPTDLEDVPSIPELTPEREETESPLRDVTFEKAREEKHDFSDEFIKDLLDQNLRNPGQNLHILKNYMDEVPADESDKEFSTNIEAIVAVHEQLTDFVADEIRVLSSPQNEAYFEQLEKGFAKKIQATKPAFREYVTGRVKGLNAADLITPEDAIDFRGFNAPVSGGRSVNLLTTKVDGAYPNIKIQDGTTAPFIHWSSQRVLEEKAAGRQPKFTRRVYLNPKMINSVEVFKDLVHKIEEESLEAKAKLYDPINNSVAAKDPEALEKGFSVRGDTIVVYATESDAENLLETIKEVYASHEDAFKDRKVSRTPLQVAPGVGLGDEPAGGGDSLTSHRVKVMEDVRDVVRNSGEIDTTKQIEQFRLLWRMHARKEEINPDNPAFNS